MTIQELADNNRLRVRRDECLDPVIMGKFGHLYEHGHGRIGVCIFNPAEKNYGVRRMGHRMRKLVALGLEIRQQGDSEGTFLIPSVLIDSTLPSAFIRAVCKIVGITRIGKQRGKPFPKVANAS